MRDAVAVVAVAVAVLAMSACTGISSVEAFDREQADADLLPREITEMHSDDSARIDGASSRLLAEEGGVQFFAARAKSDTDDLLCLILYPESDPGKASSTCGGGAIGVGNGALGVRAELVEASFGERDGWRMLAPNLYVQE